MPNQQSHITLEEPCTHCENNNWTQYVPDDETDVWYECMTDDCIGVRFDAGAAAVEPDTSHHQFIAIGIPELSRDALEDALKTHLPDELAENLQINPRWQHPDWEEGNPCPHCGHPVVNELTAKDDLYRSSNGEYHYQKSGDHITTAGHVACGQCTRPLRRDIQPLPV